MAHWADWADWPADWSIVPVLLLFVVVERFGEFAMDEIALKQGMKLVFPFRGYLVPMYSRNLESMGNKENNNFDGRGPSDSPP